MKYRPSRSFLLLIAIFAASGAGGTLVWRKIKSVPSHVRVNSSWWDLLTYEDQKAEEPLTPEELAQTKEQAAKIIAELVARNPALAIPSVTVSAEKNGFLQLHLITGPGREARQVVSKEFIRSMDDKTAWNTEEIRKLLVEHRDLIDKVTAIGMLKERSASEMPNDYDGFISARAARALSDLLLASAKLAALDGDWQGARDYIKASLGIADHYGKLEERNLLMTTVAILLRDKTKAWTLTEILPLIQSAEDLGRWRPIFQEVSQSQREFAGTIRGEWHYLFKMFILPTILLNRPNSPPDSDELMDFIANRFVSVIENVSARSLGEIEMPILESPQADQLSKKSRRIVNLTCAGSNSWGNGLIRHTVKETQFLVAFEFLMLEGSENAGDPKQWMQSLPKNPLNGRPFVYDEAKRTLSTDEPVGRDLLIFTLPKSIY